MSNKGKTFPAQPLDRSEVAALLGACSKRAKTGVRDMAFIAVLYRGQLRVSEALALKLADVNLAECTLRVLHGKGDKARVVVVDPQTMELLTNWLKVREAIGLNGVQPIFCTLKGGKVATAQIRAMMPRRAKKAGIEKRVHCHGLRHTGASELLDEGVPLVEISEQLGHSSPTVTATYLHNLNPLARIERLRARVWASGVCPAKADAGSTH